MSEPIKFTEEEMKELKEIQDAYFNIQSNFGQAKVSKIRLEKQMDNLIQFEENLSKEFTDTQDKENTFIKKITDTYGDGELNPNDGTFIPAKSKK